MQTDNTGKMIESSNHKLSRAELYDMPDPGEPEQIRHSCAAKLRGIVVVAALELLFGSSATLAQRGSVDPPASAKREHSSTPWPEITQKPYEHLLPRDLGLKPLLVTSDGQPIRSEEAWEKERQLIRAVWLKQLGEPPAKPKSLSSRVESREIESDHIRELVSFASEDDDRIRAYLLVPKDLPAAAQRPAVVVFHPTTSDTFREPVGLGKRRDQAVALELVRRGYITLSPECFIMKASGPRSQAQALAQRKPRWTGLGKMTFDASRCVDYLETVPQVDRSRIACIGHSLGAKEVLYAMAFEPRYRLGVFNEGGIGLRMSNWTDPWYLTEAIKPHIPTMEHHQILALIAPRPFLVLGGDSADGDASWAFVKESRKVYALLGASDRIGLYNHKAGHAFPKQARQLAYQWIDDWLGFRHLTRPEIKKLGTLDLLMVETTPVVFGDRLYRFEYVRENYPVNKTGASYFRFIDVATGIATPAFAKGQHLGCAFVDGETMYAFGTDKWGGSNITVFQSNDLQNWHSQSALTIPGWELFNTSVCKADGRYVMAIEVGAPKEVVGVPFTIFFAESKDLLTWKLLPQECVYSKEKYTACPALRYLDGYFYMIYLEARPGPTYETYIVRSSDLKRWESSRLNPVLTSSEGDKRIANPKLTPEQRKAIAQAKDINNSDVDLCEFKGKTIIYYSWGNQQGTEFLAEAMYDGTLAEFLRGWFP
jgi:dienelactone hydrolase